MASGKSVDLSSATEDVVRDLVARAEEKLAALQDRKGQLRKRIQALNYLAKTFEKSRHSAQQAAWSFSEEDAHDNLEDTVTESAATPQ